MWEREPRQTARPSLIVSPLEFHRQHGTHVPEFCEWLCFPRQVFDDFVRLTIAAGNDEPTAIEQVTAWAHAVRASWTTSGRIPGDNIFEFWRNEWKATHGSNRPANGSVDVLAGLR